MTEIPAHVVDGVAGPGAVIVSTCAEPLAHRVENLTTARLDRVHLTLADGARCSVVAKALRPASASPGFASIPPEHHAQVLEDLHWLDEPHVYRSGLRDVLPPSLRMPTVHGIEQSDDDVVLWLEDVDDVSPWSLDRYERTASALGALAGQWDAADAIHRFSLGRRPMRRLFDGKIRNFDLRIQADDGFWSEPGIAAAADRRHRADLFALAEATPRLLDALETLPEGVCHGDAAPDNFREPGDGSIVALDWSYGHVGAIGSDLGQLFAGRFESGIETHHGFDDVARAISTGFADGLASVDRQVSTDQVRVAWAAHLVVRSLFSLLIIERDDTVGDARVELLARRAALGRWGMDMAFGIIDALPSP